MTCIVGITTPNKIYLGGDRGVSDCDVVISTCRPKIYKINKWVFGYAGAIGTGQLLEFINFPEVVADPYKTLRLDIVEQYRKAIASFGNEDDDSAAEVLIGYQNRLFEFNTIDWSVIEVEVSAVGSGNHFALGSLYTTRGQDPLDRIQQALESAIYYSPSCKGPGDIIST